MNTFFFGRTDRSLFGAYHPPQGRHARKAGVVLCYPMGQEYMRSHRAFRQMANLLSRKGYHVLRFDWYGTGDSMGESSEFSMEACFEDLDAAILELRENAGIDRVSIVGLRLGATVASLAVGRRADVDRVVLWDPVVSGARLLASLVGDRQPRADETIGALGFPLTPGLRRSFSDLSLCAMSGEVTARFSIFVSAPSELYDSLQRDWRTAGVRFDFQCIPALGNWNEVDNFGSALVPQELIGAIVASFEKEPS